jgi:hypothetical protein
VDKKGERVMAYYMIHTCEDRYWYVKDFLLPSMIKQGINQDHILVYRDKNRIGNLRAWVHSCNRLSFQARYARIKNVWHLQDDVVISNDFKKITEEYENHEIVCGFTCGYDKEPQAGTFLLEDRLMWYSFPCINISTVLTTSFANWANGNLWQSQHFKEAVKKNNCDDLIFREWLYDNHGSIEEINLAPNVVNHIDKWLGGSICNKQRDPDKDTMSIFWEDKGELATLKKELESYKKRYKTELL